MDGLGHFIYAYVKLCYIPSIFATVVATNLFGVLGERMDWRTIILGIAGFIGLILAITIFNLRLPEEEEVKLELLL